MGVSREIKMEFNGESYTFSPSNKLLRRIDVGLAPLTLFGILGQMDGKQAPLPAIAYILSELLNEGGGDFTEEDLLGHLIQDVANNKGKGIRSLMEAITEAISIPSGTGSSVVPSSGNSVPPSSGGTQEVEGNRKARRKAKKAKKKAKNIPE